MKVIQQNKISYREQLKTNNGFTQSKEKTAHLAMAECMEDIRINGYTDAVFAEMFNIFKFHIFLQNVI